VPAALAERAGRVRAAVLRATLVPLLIRGGAGLCLLLAVVVAYPVALLASRYLLLLLAVAAWPAFAPRGRGVTVAVVVVLAGWLLDTSWYGERVALWRVLALAALLYVAHALAALAAALPYDALVNLDVVAAWLARALAVVLVSAVLTVVALGLSSALAGAAFVVATLAGLAAAVGATLLLARLLRRP
jgi:hypothetical protein